MGFPLNKRPQTAINASEISDFNLGQLGLFKKINVFS